MGALLQGLGGVWLVVNTTHFFFPDLTSWLVGQKQWAYTLAFLWAAFRSYPKLSAKCQLKGTNTTIEVVIGDLFARKDASIVVGTNSTFDTEMSTGLIDAKSLQGLVTKRFYDDPKHIDNEVQEALKGAGTYTVLTDGRTSKVNRYPIGTTIQIQPRKRHIYLVAITHMSENGTCQSDFPMVKDALAGLWAHVGSAGKFGDLSVPLLGMGFSRVQATREQVIHEIIRSFIAACSERRFCEHLRIVVGFKDFQKNNIDLNIVRAFLEHECRYAELGSTKREGAGKAVT